MLNKEKLINVKSRNGVHINAITQCVECCLNPLASLSFIFYQCLYYMFHNNKVYNTSNKNSFANLRFKRIVTYLLNSWRYYLQLPHTSNEQFWIDTISSYFIQQTYSIFTLLKYRYLLNSNFLNID